MHGKPEVPQSQVWDGVKEQFSRPTHDSDLSLIEIVRAAHNDHVIVRTAQRSCDFLGYAKAGHATARLHTEGGDFDATRKFRAASKRNDKPGTLGDVVAWGCYHYEWDGKTFLIYKYERTESFRGVVVKFFICYPGSAEEIQAAQSTSIDELLSACGQWTHLLHDEVYVYDNGWHKNKKLWTSIKDASWDDVILDPTTKSNIREDVEGFFDSKDLYKQLGVPWKRGIIFHGHPGNGKTISIKALVSTLYARKDEIPGLYVKSLKVCQGKEFAIRSIFEHARSMSPCLLIFEDLDSLVTNDVRSYFLNEVDGLESNDGILMIGSTNHLDKLDPAISKRPSRFDRKYHFKLPDTAERALYCEFWKDKVAQSKTMQWPEGASRYIAQITDGFSYAYLKELFVMTLLNITRGAKIPSSEEQAKDQDAAKEKNSVWKTLESVHVPEDLREDAFIQHTQHHVRLLLGDMDNTAE